MNGCNTWKKRFYNQKGSMLEPLKLLTLKAKLILSGIVLGAFLLFTITSSIIYYNKGLAKGTAISVLELEKYKSKSLALETELRTAEARVEVRVVKDYITRTNTVTRNVEGAERVIVQYLPSQESRLSQGWVNAYNAVVDDRIPTEEETSIAAPASVDNTVVLTTAINNLAICKLNTEQLVALQAWTQGVHNASVDVNNGN